MKYLKCLAFTTLLFWSLSLDAQGLVGILVEAYYIADDQDAAADPNHTLNSGAVTYRIFAQLKPDYKLLTVYGAPGNPLFFKTTTSFYNNGERSKQSGTEFRTLHLMLHTTPLDSYLAIGGASNRHIAIPKALDPDGSIYSLAPVDSSAGEKRLLLRNSQKSSGIPLYVNDGLIVEPKGIAHLRTFGELNLDVFGNLHVANEFVTENGAWAVAGGLKLPATENNLFIAQLTTDGDLSFQINLQIQSDHGVTEYYVATDPVQKELSHLQLTYPNTKPLND
jgi:hypothetical protein